MIKLIHALITVLLLLCTNLTALELKTAAQESSPKFIKNADGSITGIGIDVMRAISKLDPAIKFTGDQEFVPFRRIEVQVENGDLDIFFGFVKNKERETKYVFIDPPIYNVADVLVVRNGDPVEIQNLEDIKKLGKDGVVLLGSGVAQVDQLKNMGITVDDGGKTPAVNLQKLLVKRGRFVMQSEVEIREAIRCEKLEDRVKILPVKFNEGGRYIAFSKKVPAETIAKVKSALEKLAKSGELKKIYAKYNL